MTDKRIPLNHGKYALVDDEDYDFLMQWEWSFSSHGYAVRRQHLGMFDGKQKRRIIIMHRIIMNTPAGMYTDHINGNPLDNRRSNLRVCTNSQNLMNQKKQMGRSSKYKGVNWHKNNKNWQAQIKINQKTKYIGCFSSEIEAAVAYDAAAIKYFGEFAKLNLPPNSPVKEG